MANTKVQSEQIQDGSITADKIADGAIVATELADNAVTTAKINADAVTGAKIADDAIDSEHYTDGSIDTAHIADSQITVAKMAANSVDSDQYVDGSIDTAHLGDLQVTTAKIANGNISTAKIADNAVTSAKLDTNIDIAGTLDVTGATTLDAGLTVDTTTLVVDATNNRVGIATASPVAELNVDGRIVIDDGARSNPTGGASLVLDYQTTSNLEGRIRSRDWDGATWKNLTIEAYDIILSPDNNVGIGTQSPTFTNGSGLEIERAGIATLRLEDTGSGGKPFEIFTDDGTGYQLRGLGSGMPMIFSTVNTERLRIETDGFLKLAGGSGFGSLHNTGQNVTDTFTNYFDFSTLQPGSGQERGMYLVALSRNGGSVGSRLLAFIGVSTNSTVYVYEILASAVLSIQGNGSALQVKHASTGTQSIQGTAIPVAIDHT